MPLQFITGNSGAGKSYAAFFNIIEEAGQRPDGHYYVLVPEQFTMQTQRTLVEMQPDGGILNIDVLSFERLAYRVFEEVGGDTRRILEETGKNMVLMKLVQEKKNELVYLKNQMKKPGYLDQVKSLISEFMQYEVGEEELLGMQKEAENQGLLGLKLKDILVLYRAFREYLAGHYMTAEEVLEVLAEKIRFSENLKGSVVLLDGYTGFTPVQMDVIRELLVVCRRVMVTVTIDGQEPLFAKGKTHHLFSMSRRMIHALAGLTKEQEEPVVIVPGKYSRFAKAPALAFLEQNLFRYRREVYHGEQREIDIFSAVSPQKELEEAARRIIRMVREEDYRYGEIAVITGDLGGYGSLARQVFSDTGIPFFIDEKHSILMNPFVEYVRSALEMAAQNFSYESVFRYLRCGMSDITREETDELENYVIALGIRGFKSWDGTWVRIYRGMAPERLLEVNKIRSRFVEETRELAEGFGGGKKTVLEYCRCLYGFIVRSRIQQKLKIQEEWFRKNGDRAMEKEYAQIYGIVMELLDKMAEILGEEKVRAEEFRQILETGMSQATVALIPPSMDQVLVGDMERTRLKDVRALFFVGVNDGCIPKNTDSGGMLTEMDREFLEDQGITLAPGPKELMNIQQFYLYLNLTKPSQKLSLSYSLDNGKGEAAGPAFLIYSVQRLFPALKVQRAEEPESPADRLETPGTALDFFLEGLSVPARREEDLLFRELYSWYLRNPRYAPLARRLAEASFAKKTVDCISRSVAKALYGEVSPGSATRLEKFSACAFAHFLRYGLKAAERSEYEFRAMDMGNVVHQALEGFAAEVQREGLVWGNLSEADRTRIADECLDRVAADYGNTILQSSERNRYMIERTRRLLQRTVWALQEQLKNGRFVPEGFEVAIGGGRIDRLDVFEKDGKIYVKIIDYKTGNTSFDLLEIYHGLQLQLVIYMDAAVLAEQKKHPDCEVKPAGIFYYNVKDPLLQADMERDMKEVSAEIRKKLKMNGLVLKEEEVVEALDSTLESLPVSYNKDGSFRKGSRVAEEERFRLLSGYVKNKIEKIRTSITDGKADLNPFELGNKNACAYCPYQGACGFDKKLPGCEFRRLKQFSDEEIWKAFAKEAE